jgi:hypothetical protein
LPIRSAFGILAGSPNYIAISSVSRRPARFEKRDREGRPLDYRSHLIGIGLPVYAESTATLIVDVID